GAAMRTGIEQATGDAVLIYDPDEPYPAESLQELVAALDRADLVTLSPYHPHGAVEGVPWGRLLLSRGASRLYRWRLRVPLHTYTCAVRAYRLPGARELVTGAPDDFTAAAYLLAAAVARKWRIHEVPAVLRPRPAGRSKMRLFRTIRSHLRLLGDLPVTPPRHNTGS
ncbi:MAG: glycosyltransferase, partial [Planctomycetota bacterium]|nr:glycosyltransferase [Planctomycetota bacterium]